MTDPGADATMAVTAQEAEFMKKMFEFFLRFSESSQEGGASSSNPFNVPQKDKKTPQKKKKEPNKKLEALNKRNANEKAKNKNTVKEINKIKMLAAKERVEKRIEKRKSLLQKDEAFLEKLDEKINKETDP